MGIVEKYTTAELISKEASDKPLEKPEDLVEPKKITLSNDAFAMAQLLETLINKLDRLVK